MLFARQIEIAEGDPAAGHDADPDVEKYFHRCFLGEERWRPDCSGRRDRSGVAA
jgi:hypothetical protein